MTSGVSVGWTFQANQCRVSPGKKYSSAKATNRKGTMTAPRIRVERNTRSSRMRPSTPAPEPGQCFNGVMDWDLMLSRRARAGGDDELATILAGPPAGTLGMTGGFPNASTFPTEELA